MDYDNLKELIENLHEEEEIEGFQEDKFLELFDDDKNLSFLEDNRSYSVSQGLTNKNEYENREELDNPHMDEKEESFSSLSSKEEKKEVIEEDDKPDEEVEEMDNRWREEVEVYKPEEEEEVYYHPPPTLIMNPIEKKEHPLEKNGYLFLKSVFHPEIIDRLNYEIQGFMNEEGIYSHLQKRQDVSQSRYFVNNTYGALKNFYQLQHYYVPVIDNRGTYNRITDVGVIDFYNVDRLFPQIRTFFELDVILMILLKTTGLEWKLSRINLQYYINVINPNAFHYDNGNERHIKVTIYLNDILDEYSGPISYIEGSHLNKRGVKASHTKVFTGRKGDVLISYQNGYHRRLPQRIQSTNGFLTFHFTTKSERQKFFPPELRL